MNHLAFGCEDRGVSAPGSARGADKEPSVVASAWEVAAASGIEIAPSTGPESRELFLLAKNAFGDLPGWSDRRVVEILERDVVFVARESDAAAGYVALRVSEGETMTVDQLLVAPGHERRGVGRRLLAHAEGYAIASHAKALRIVVEEGNRSARSLYLRSGFVPLGPELLELILPRTD